MTEAKAAGSGRLARQSATVVIHHSESPFKNDMRVDHIEVRRDARASLSIFGNSYAENPINGRRTWFARHKTKGIKSPLAVRAAIDEVAGCLGVTVQWTDAIPMIASIDWLTAAVIASNRVYEIPVMPAVDVLLSQRSLRTIGRVTLGAEWAYELNELSIPFERWLRILGGEPWAKEQPYWYEGERFHGAWCFGGDGQLRVTFGDDGGVGWDGELDGLDLIEGPSVDDVDLAELALRATSRRNQLGPKRGEE